MSSDSQQRRKTKVGRIAANAIDAARAKADAAIEQARKAHARLWVGGMAPLGYDTKDRKITVNEAEADRVRSIFRGYLKLGSLNLLMADLRTRGLVTKVRPLKTGETVGGIPFGNGREVHLLRV